MPADDPAAAAAATFNMTPMIDVVFQLIIFLMLANDMSRREIEELDLPGAPHGSEDDGLEKHRIIVNLLRGEPPGAPPTLKVRGREMTLEEFRRFMGPEVARAGASDLYVLLRADRNSRWQDVQWVMQALAAPELGISRLQFATHNPQADGPAALRR